ncbi:MAG: hypothetical protein AAF657_12415 [Acidobacteriota bacterium]
MRAQNRDANEPHRIEALSTTDDPEHELVDSPAIVGPQKVTPLDHVDRDLDQGTALGDVSQGPTHRGP